MAHYIIADYGSYADAWQYVSRVGETPDECFYATVPYNNKDADSTTPPIEFLKRNEAQRVLDQLRTQEKKWKVGLYHRPSKWKIYKIEE